MQKQYGMWLPDDDTHFTDHMAKGPIVDGRGTYQYEKITMAMNEVTKRYDPKQCVALDIGAHVGFWSLQLCKHFSHVSAFEPLEEHANCFTANLAEHLILPKPGADYGTVAGGRNVALHQLALGNDTGVVYMNTVEGNSGNAHIAGLMSDDVQQKHTAIMTRLDDLAFPAVAFIKIDVEGYELDVIKGAARHILLNRPVMVVEQKATHGRRYGHGDTDAVKLLHKWGAKTIWQKNGDYCLAFN